MPLPSGLTVHGMDASSTPVRARRALSADGVLATNLVIARLVLGMTQHDLAKASGVSRATIAQLETGSSDPRLSTLVELAKGLGISHALLLTGLEEAQGFAAVRVGADGAEVPVPEFRKMQGYLSTGSIKDRLRAARLGASVGRRLHPGSTAAAVAAAILSATLPGPGTAAGAAFGAAQPNI